jgi:hypothetical protein
MNENMTKEQLVQKFSYEIKKLRSNLHIVAELDNQIDPLKVFSSSPLIPLLP